MTYSNEVINLCILHYNNNVKISQISKMTNVSSMTIHRWVCKYNYYFINNIPMTDDIFNQIKKITIHGSSKSHLYEKTISEYIKNNEGCSLNDILENNPSVKLSKSTVCVLLKKNNITHKKINNRVVGKNVEKIEEERKLFACKITDDNFLNAIAIDETSKCVNDHKRYGYSKKGDEIKKIFKHKKNRDRRTLLAAVTNKKFINKKIIKGSVNGETYLDFFKENKKIFKK